jgi:hypothetical protein
MPPDDWIAALGNPFADAIRRAHAYIVDRFSPIGFVVSGTIVRGEHHPGSDLDIVVIHEHPWRQRVQRYFNDVPAELFVNPPWAIRQSFDLEVRNGRPAMLHMLATGRIMSDQSAIVADLCEHATKLLVAGPMVAPVTLQQSVYAAASMFEDGVDLRHEDPERSMTLIHASLLDAINLWFLQQALWQPRPKRLIAAVEAREPILGTLVRDVLRTQDADERIARSTEAMERLIGTAGFFVWEGERESRPAP